MMGVLAVARLENNVVYVKVTGFPIKHVYFEKLLMGYFKQAIKVFGKKSAANDDQESDWWG